MRRVLSPVFGRMTGSVRVNVDNPAMVEGERREGIPCICLPLPLAAILSPCI